jgi:uncharacterized membrane protein
LSSSANLIPSAGEPAEFQVTCPHCSTEAAASEAFCPACGWSMKPLAVADRGLAALAYLTLIPAATLLLLPAYRRHRFIRFHAWQSVLIWGAFLALTAAAVLLSSVAAAVLLLLVGVLASLAMFFLWVVLSIKAWQGERFELPWFGELAERLS